MSATAKTLGSLGLAVAGLLAYVGIFLGYSVFKISFLGLALYLGIGLTALLFLVVLATTAGRTDKQLHG